MKRRQQADSPREAAWRQCILPWEMQSSDRDLPDRLNRLREEHVQPEAEMPVRELSGSEKALTSGSAWEKSPA